MGRKTRRIGIRERLDAWRNARRRSSAKRTMNWVLVLKVAAAICFFAASGAFLRYAEGYVKSASAAKEGRLELLDIPDWVDYNLQARLAAVAGGTRFPLTDETASVIARNIAPLVWLDDVSVRVTHDAVQVRGRWRKPVARIEIKQDSSRIYVDGELVVLDYMPMPHLPIVEIKGVGPSIIPLPGQTFAQEDLAAGVALARLLYRMDAEVTPDTPLLEHIANIDVSNFKGRKSRREPHIVLRTKDDTQILYGAQIGEWSKYLEATDQQKLAKLYTYYREFGSLSARVKYIDLRDPQDKVPQPIDKYR